MRVAAPGCRSVVRDTSEGLSIVVPAKRNPFVLVFIAAWLVDWCMGEISRSANS